MSTVSKHCEHHIKMLWTPYQGTIIIVLLRWYKHKIFLKVKDSMTTNNAIFIRGVREGCEILPISWLQGSGVCPYHPQSLIVRVSLMPMHAKLASTVVTTAATFATAAIYCRSCCCRSCYCPNDNNKNTALHSRSMTCLFSTASAHMHWHKEPESLGTPFLSQQGSNLCWHMGDTIYECPW